MVDQVIPAWFHIRRCGKVHSICLADSFDLFPCSSQPDKIWMELLQVTLDHSWSVARRIASNEDRSHKVATGGLNKVDYASHFIEFLRTNVRAVRKAEINLFSIIILAMCSRNHNGSCGQSNPVLYSRITSTPRSLFSTYQRVFSLQIRICKYLSLL